MTNNTTMKTNIKTAAALLMSLALFGCGAEKEQKATQAPASQSAQSSAIVLQNGEKLNTNGEISKEYEKETSNGKMKHYEVNTNTLAKVAENAIYNQLKSQGFQRTVMEDNPSQFKVHYKKTGYSTIGAIYTESSANNVNTTKMKIYWTET